MPFTACFAGENWPPGSWMTDCFEATLDLVVSMRRYGHTLSLARCTRCHTHTPKDTSTVAKI